MNEVCPSCGSFTDSLGELTGWCVECDAINGIDAKPCGLCRLTKPLTDYGHRTKDGPLRSTCRSCESARRQAHRLANPEHTREIERRSYYRRRLRAQVSAQPIPRMGT